jgi:hypothetical protein
MAVTYSAHEIKLDFFSVYAKNNSFHLFFINKKCVIQLINAIGGHHCDFTGLVFVEIHYKTYSLF